MPLTRRQSKSIKAQNQIEVPLPPKQKRKPIEKRSKLTRKMLRSRIRERLLRRQNIEPTKTQTLMMSQIQELSHSQKLSCPICLELFVCPTVTQCGHIFCLSCAEECLKHKGSCSLCRSDVSLQEFKPQKLLEQLVELKLKKEADNQTIENYNRRIKQFQLEESRRKIDFQIKVGDSVDFWNDRSWKGGKVMDLGIDEKGQKTIKVQSQRSQTQSKIYQFVINSRLIAKHRTFSKESDSFLRCWPQIRIDIFDIRDGFSPLFWNEPMMGRRMVSRPAVRVPFIRPGTRVARIDDSEEQDSESLIRFTFSFERPQN